MAINEWNEVMKIYKTTKDPVVKKEAEWILNTLQDGGIRLNGYDIDGFIAKHGGK